MGIRCCLFTKNFLLCHNLWSENGWNRLVIPSLQDILINNFTLSIINIHKQILTSK